MKREEIADLRKEELSIIRRDQTLLDKLNKIDREIIKRVHGLDYEKQSIADAVREATNRNDPRLYFWAFGRLIELQAKKQILMPTSKKEELAGMNFQKPSLLAKKMKWGLLYDIYFYGLNLKSGTQPKWNKYVAFKALMNREYDGKRTGAYTLERENIPLLNAVRLYLGFGHYRVLKEIFFIRQKTGRMPRERDISNVPDFKKTLDKYYSGDYKKLISEWEYCFEESVKDKILKLPPLKAAEELEIPDNIIDKAKDDRITLEGIVRIFAENPGLREKLSKLFRRGEERLYPYYLICLNNPDSLSGRLPYLSGTKEEKMEGVLKYLCR